MAENLTPSKTARLRYDPDGPRIQWLWDAQSPGLGIETFQRGLKSWVLRYRFGGKQRILTIRRSADMDLEEAREEAGRLRRRIADGQDPKAVRELRANAPTVRELFEQYKATRYFATRSKDFRSNFPCMIERYLLPVVGDQKPDTVARSQLRGIVDGIIDQGKEGAARGALTHFKILFSYARELELLDASPAEHIRPGYTGTARRRVWLQTPEKLRAAWHIDAPIQARALVRWALLTGCRRDEARLSGWDTLDKTAGVWRVVDTKNGRDLVLPIMPMMESILAELRQTYRNAAWLFPATTEHRKPIPRASLDYVIRTTTKGQWSMHVLRHTVESHLAELKVMEEVRDMILSHHRQSMGSRYNHAEQIGLKRQGLAQWHELLAGVVSS